MYPTEEQLESKRAHDKKMVQYYALSFYKNDILKRIEKEKKQLEKTSLRLKEVLADNPSKARRTTANARHKRNLDYLAELETKAELLDELIEENK